MTAAAHRSRGTWRRLGRRAEAIAAYQAAIALEPPAPEGAYLARRMRELA